MAGRDPTFNDAALRFALDYAKEVVEGNREMLDRVTADIRTLEDYLARSAIRIMVEAPLGRDECIRWELAEPPRRWRILYRQGESFAAPLLETKAVIRLRARGALPTLLRRVAEAAAMAGDPGNTAPPAPDTR